MKPTFVFVLLFLPFTEIANAQIGAFQEVLDAGFRKQQPAYIHELMVALGQKLNKLVRTEKIHNSKQKLAWMLTAYGVISIADQAAQSVTSSDIEWTALQNVNYNLRRDIEHVLGERGYIWSANVADEGICHTSYDGVYDAPRKVAEAAVPADLHYFMATYRIAEWAVLNWFLTNINTVVGNVYPKILRGLSDSPKNNPFKHDDNWVLFLDRLYLDQMGDTMLFLAPWLAPILPKDQVPEKHRVLFQLMDPLHPFG